MGFTRTEIRVEVTGAEEGARAMRGLAAAEDKVSESAIRERLSVQDAEQAIVRKVRAEQAAKQAIEDALKPTTEMTKQTGLLAKAGELASSGLTMLRKAAEIIPGMELGTIIAGVAAGVYALYKAFGPATDATDKQTAAFKAQAAAARDLAAAQRGLLRGEIGAGAAALRQTLDRLGPGVTPEAQDQVIRLAALRQQAERARDEAIQRSVRRAGGLVPVSDAEQQRIEALQAERNKLIEQAQERDGADFKLSFKERSALAVQAQAFQVEIDKIRDEANKAADWKLSEVVNQTTADLANLDRQLRGFGAGGPAPRAEGGGGRAGGGRVASMPTVPGPTTTPMFSIAPAPGEDLTPRGIDNVVSLDAWKAKRAAEAAAQAQEVINQRNNMMAGHATPAGVPAMPEVPSLLKMMTASDEERAAFDQQMADAGAGIKGLYSETQRLADDGVNMLSGLGRGLSQAAAASLLTGKSFRAAANELLKSLAVQAAGQAIWETALGIGSLAMAAMGTPGALASAGLHFKAAGVFAGLSAAFAGGAGLTGGMRGGGGGGASAGGGGGMASAAGTNPYQPSQRAPQPIVIQIGAEVVTRVVDGERRREARRDGITAREAA